MLTIKNIKNKPNGYTINHIPMILQRKLMIKTLDQLSIVKTRFKPNCEI